MDTSTLEAMRATRIAVWENTFEIVSTAPPGSILDPAPAKRGVSIFFGPDGAEDDSTTAPDTSLSSSSPTSKRPKMSSRPSTITVVKADCMDVAVSLTQAGFKTLLMDAGSRGHFGGGYQNGARAQEEDICRRSNLALIMDPLFWGGTTNGDACSTATRKQDEEGVNGNDGCGNEEVEGDSVYPPFYPLAPEACIHVPHVGLFRGSNVVDYAPYPSGPCSIGVGIVAATRNPVIVAGHMRPDIFTKAVAAIRNFLFVAYEHGYRAVVLVPLGCGAYNNPPNDIVKAFDEALSTIVSPAATATVTLRDVFEHIVFAILDFPPLTAPVSPSSTSTPSSPVAEASTSKAPKRKPSGGKHAKSGAPLAASTSVVSSNNALPSGNYAIFADFFAKRGATVVPNDTTPLTW